jgi:adhesin HecA-like repeat protein
MARRDDALGMTGADTVIGAGVQVEGNLHSEGDVVIDGRLSGEVKATGNVTIGVNAEVHAPVEAGGVTIAGHLRGEIKARGDVTITATGNLEGDVTAAGLAIESGGVFNGRSKIKASPLPDLAAKAEA